MKINYDKIEKFTVLILVMAPFLNIYESPIHSVGVCDLLLIFLLVYYFLYGIIYKFNISFICKYKFLIINVLIVNYILVMFYTEFYMVKDISLRTLRYLLYLSIGVLFSVSFERRKDAIKYFEFFSVISTILIIVQNLVLKISGYYITGIIPFLKLMNDAGFNEQIYNIYNMGGRPYSFFSEPSTYGMYTGLCLALELYINEKNLKTFLIRWLLTVGLILSGSTTGLTSVIILYGGLLINKLYHNNLNFQVKDIIFVIMLMPLLVVVLLKSNTVQSMIFRIKDGGSIRDRFEGYKIFWEPMNPIEMFLGHGMNDNINDYFMSSIPRLYYYWGIVGMVLIIILFVYIFQKVDRVSRIVLAFVLFTNIATVWSWGQFTLLSFSLLTEKRKTNKSIGR